jgi:protein-tyrosine phosphatase
MIGNHLDEIVDGLFIGNAHAASSYQILCAHNIGAVVNVAKTLNDPLFNGIQTYKVGLADGHAELENYSYMYAFAAHLVISLLGKGVKVLLHCYEGISRSPAVGVLIVSKMKGVSLDKAQDLIREKRPIVFINKGHKKFIMEARDLLDQIE